MFNRWRKGAAKAVSGKRILLKKDKKSSSSKTSASYITQVTALWLGTTIVLTYLIFPIISMPIPSLRVGDISPHDIKAPKDFQVEDKATTEKRQYEAEAKVLAIYDFDDRLLANINQKLNHAFDLLTEFGQSTGEDKVADKKAQESAAGSGSSSQSSSSSVLSIEDQWEYFKDETSLALSLEDFKYLVSYPQKDQLKSSISHLVNQIMLMGVVGSLNFPLEEERKGFIKRNIVTGQETVIKDTKEIFDEQGAREYAQKAAKSLFPQDHRANRLVAEMVKGLIYPNMTLNLSETRLRKLQAIESVKPSFFQIKKGEMIVREGEKVTESQVAKINELIRIMQQENVFLSFFGLAMLILLTLLMLFLFIHRYKLSMARNIKDLFLVALIVTVTIFFNKMFVYIANGLSATVSQIEPSSYFYAFPFAAAAMLTAVLLDTQIAVMVAAVTAIFSSMLLGKNFYVFLVAFFGGVGATYGLLYKAHRTAIVRGGAMVSLVNLAIIIPLDLTGGILLSSQGISDCIFGVVGGLASATLVSALVPVFESLFKLTTDIKLLELLNMNQPILRRLAMEAPGTYHHSIVVGNLAEAACEAIGANSLLARVASNYHDIGKVKKPRYFVENQMNFKNIHERLAPSMSGLILISHVRDGVELAKQNKISPAIIDIISQHHGTSLIKFFYKKAKDQEEQKLQVIKEEAFRYPGPKPQTKEAGIVMLADVVEAASRTLTDPSPSRIQGLILNIINHIFTDGQLDECELTLKDLHQIADSFNRILIGIFHQRIAYPDIQSGASGGEGKKGKGGDSTQKSTKDDKNKYPLVEEGSKENIRRLGIANPGGEYNIRSR
ncbi:MAG: HDIG domain-containing protein [bacterium]|nr:HDIG domain-containing protein [bacterium]